MNFFSHLECGYCTKTYEADNLWNLCLECSKPLLARYDLASAKQKMSREDLKKREPNLWRYNELLPVSDIKFILSLGEVFSPLFKSTRLC
jgi:threonine synthase